MWMLHLVPLVFNCNLALVNGHLKCYPNDLYHSTLVFLKLSVQHLFYECTTK